MTKENKSTVSVLLEAEKVLAFNVLKAAFASTSEEARLKQFKFVASSITSIITVHRSLYPKDLESISHWQELFASTVNAVAKTERTLNLERRIAAMKEKDG